MSTHDWHGRRMVSDLDAAYARRLRRHLWGERIVCAIGGILCGAAIAALFLP